MFACDSVSVGVNFFPCSGVTLPIDCK